MYNLQIIFLIYDPVYFVNRLPNFWTNILHLSLGRIKEGDVAFPHASRNHPPVYVGVNGNCHVSINVQIWQYLIPHIKVFMPARKHEGFCTFYRQRQSISSDNKLRC